MKPEIGVCSEMTNTILRQEAEIKILQRDLAEAQRGLKVHPEDIPLLDEITEAKRQLIEAQPVIKQRDQAIAACAKMREALDMGHNLIGHSNPKAFDNGVTDSSGIIDEGAVIAYRIYVQMRDALATDIGKQFLEEHNQLKAEVARLKEECAQLNKALSLKQDLDQIQRDLIEAQHQNVHLREAVKRLEAEIIQLSMFDTKRLKP